MADHGDYPRRLQRCLGSTQFLWVPGMQELQKMCVPLYFSASYTHTCALMGTPTLSKKIGIFPRKSDVNYEIRPDKLE